jgi:hypothetical protein
MHDAAAKQTWNVIRPAPQKWAPEGLPCHSSASVAMPAEPDARPLQVVAARYPSGRVGAPPCYNARSHIVVYPILHRARASRRAVDMVSRIWSHGKSHMRRR